MARIAFPLHDPDASRVWLLRPPGGAPWLIGMLAAGAALATPAPVLAATIPFGAPGFILAGSRSRHFLSSFSAGSGSAVGWTRTRAI